MKYKNILEIETHDDGTQFYLNDSAFAWFWKKDTSEAELKDATDRYIEVLRVAEIKHSRRSQESV